LTRAVSRAAKGLTESAAQQVRTHTRQELEALLHGIIDAQHYERAEQLLAHPRGAALGKKLNEQLDRLFMHQLPDHRRLKRVGPERLWQGFRLRLSHGRNHGAE